MSYDSWDKGGCLTPLEQAAGLWGILHGGNNGECSCEDRGDCEKCERRYNARPAERKLELKSSARFKQAAKLVAGLSDNREIKRALIHKVNLDSLESAIVNYMYKEALPEYYAAILKSPNCIDRLVEGVFYKVCKIQPDQTLAEQISGLSRTLRSNLNRLTAYDRVTDIQQYIHHTVDQYLGFGAARLIPVAPMKNALSAARLHLNILDLIDRGPSYASFIDNLSTATSQLEYDEPRPSTAPWGKRSWPRWRVRHLRPLSYYFPPDCRVLLQELKNMDENIPTDQFVLEALRLYADS